jgi:deazaflavin-dependent oxidoreductase (nitroreductase family)
MTSFSLEERRARDEPIMAQLRANGGKTDTGQTLVILAIKGAVTGNERDKPVCVRKDGGDLFVVGSAGGQPRHPQWYTNLVANPEITVEYLGERYQAVAETEPNGPERDRLFGLLSEEVPGLYEYQDRCRDTRQIALIRIRRRAH